MDRTQFVATRLLVCALLMFALCWPADPAGARERVVALVGGTIIDGTGRPPLTGHTILIRGERIAKVGQS